MTLVKRWYLKKMILCLWKTINGNQTYKYLEKKGRFYLEIQSGGHNNWKFVCNYFCWKEDRILFKAVFQIICSHSMHALQPSVSEKLYSVWQKYFWICNIEHQSLPRNFLYIPIKSCTINNIFSWFFLNLSVPVTI